MPNEVNVVVRSTDKTDFDGAAKSADRLGGSFDKAGEAADTMEGRSQGLASTLTGTTDTMAGLGEVAKGNLYEGLVMTGQGAADLFEGLNYLVIPLAKTAAKMIASTAASVAHKTASIAASAAAKAMAAAQWLLNAAMSANPIGLVVIALVALVAGIVIAYKKSETFRDIVQKAMKAVAAAFGWVVDGFGKAWKALSGAWTRFTGWIGGWKTYITNRVSSLFSSIGSAFGTAWRTVSGAWSRFIGWIAGWPASIGRWLGIALFPFPFLFGKAWTALGGSWSRFIQWVGGWPASIGRWLVSMFFAVPNAFGKAWTTVSEAWGRFTKWVGGWKNALNFSGMFNGIWSAFRGVINAVIRGWNNLSFSLPSVDTKIPGIGRIGGWTIGTPNLPLLAKGGRAVRGGLAVVGERGAEVVDLPGGASVWPANRLGGQGVSIHLTLGSGSKFVKALMEDLRNQIRVEAGTGPGSVQKALGQ